MADKEIVLAATLLLDYNLYPRNKLSSYHVDELGEARAAGAKLPPVVADRLSRRVIDGFHRITEVLEHDGAQGQIQVIWHDYESEADMLAEAISLNATHGRKLTPQDHTRIVHLAGGFGLAMERVSNLLHVRPELLEKRGQNIAVVTTPGKHTRRGQEAIPLKRTFSNLKGKSITPQQVEANSRATGHPQSYLIGQVLNVLESDAVDLANPLVVDRLVHLRDALNSMELPDSASTDARDKSQRSSRRSR